jgi:hypothetical protein
MEMKAKGHSLLPTRCPYTSVGVRVASRCNTRNKLLPDHLLLFSKTNATGENMKRNIVTYRTNCTSQVSMPDFIVELWIDPVVARQETHRYGEDLAFPLNDKTF